MSIFENYLNRLRRNLAQGDATEHTHRNALQQLVEGLLPDLITINEARRIKCGSPDLTLRRGAIPVGHIETKNLGAPLDDIEKGKGQDGKQFLRYKAGLQNWILTDYLRFDLFVAGNLRGQATVGSVTAGGELRSAPGGAEALEALLTELDQADVFIVQTARELAVRMAGIAHLLREALLKSGLYGDTNVKSWIEQWLSGFRDTLLPDLKMDEFADMFSQTLCYGLFAARIQVHKTQQPFSYAEALLAVPRSNPLLRKLFSEMAGADMPDEFRWAVDDLVRLLEKADIDKIIKDFHSAADHRDPIVHFYETFLAAYDPKLRKQRGVYYTPEPVVRYIVRSVDYLLKHRLNKVNGLADKETLVLDPAVGTATFLYHVIAQIRVHMSGQLGSWPDYVREGLLGRLFGFELLVAPYAVAHLNIGTELERTGYRFAPNERVGIYLTNTLEEAVEKSERLLERAISDEVHQAATIKRDKQVMVVLGNPPYKGVSANQSEREIEVEPGQTYLVLRKGKNGARSQVLKTARRRMKVRQKTFIGALLEDYKWVDGKPLGERKQWTNNDYSKFIRFAQWRVEKTGHGIVGFITDNSYLDAPTFRGMRRSLMNSFDEIYILDLHGKSIKKERSKDGGSEENVFDIKQGVCIILALRKDEHQPLSTIHHTELWGSRKSKGAFLSERTLETTAWDTLKPSGPAYNFVPAPDSNEKETGSAEAYGKLLSVADLFVVGSNGVQTSRDSLVVAFSVEELDRRMKRVVAKQSSEEDLRSEFFGSKKVREYLPGDTREWSFAEARRRLAEDEEWRKHIKHYEYRPFDRRSLMYTDYLIDWPRQKGMKSISKGNRALCVGRSGQVTASSWSLVFCTETLCDHNLFYRGSSRNSPLYLLSGEDGEENRHMFPERRPNLAPASLRYISECLNLAVGGLYNLPIGITPENIFGYVYAILNAPSYRQRYSEFLKREYPRIPIIKDVAAFIQVGELGWRLSSLHLLDEEAANELSNFITTFPVAGTGEVTSLKFDPATEIVWINPQQYFGQVPERIYTFEIGGYRPCQKWLKDRKGRKLSYADTEHWQKIVLAIATAEVVTKEIDAIISGML